MAMSIKNLTFNELLVILPQYFLPHRLLSRCLGWLSHCEHEAWKNLAIKKYGKFYNINTKETVSRNLNFYPSFNHFYTRQLKPEARPITSVENGIACPVDGTVSQTGIINEGEIILAKGQKFTVSALLGGDRKRAEPFMNGSFTTICLSCKDYHRVHMPLDGTIEEAVYIPGRLFSIRSSRENSALEIYAKNERVINIFDTNIGPMALVMVGSIFSASIETVWDGVITPFPKSKICQWNYPFNPPTAQKGDEMGRFNMGSTVILLFGANKVKWADTVVPENRVKMGQLIGTIVG